MRENYPQLSLTSDNFVKDSWKMALSASAVLWGTVCFFGPIMLTMTHLPVDLIRYVTTLLIVSLSLSLLTSFCLVRLIPSSLFDLAIALIASLGFLFYTRAWLVPHDLSSSIGTLINWPKFQIYHLCGILFWSVGLALGILSKRFIAGHINSLAMVFIIFHFIFAMAWYISGPVVEQKAVFRLVDVYKNSFSKSRNILVLVLDTFSNRDFEELTDNDKTITNCFSGFTFYPDMLGGYPNTLSAVPHVMTGLYYDNSVPINTFLSDKLPTESIPGILRKASFRTEAYGVGATCLFQTPVLDNMVTETRLFLSPYEVAKAIFWFCMKCAPGFSEKNFIFFNGLWISAANDLWRIEELEKRAQTDALKSVFKYEHFDGLHPPYMLSESMKIRYPSNSVKARKEQAIATIKLCCRYLAVLKKIGAFDNSMIFILGDHGHLDDAPFPLMLWKPFDNSRPFQISSKPVCQADIIKTICEEIHVPISRPETQSLQVDGLDSPRVRRHFMFHGQNLLRHTGYLPTLREFVADRLMENNVFKMIPTFEIFAPNQRRFLPTLKVGSEIKFEKDGDYWGYTGTAIVTSTKDCVWRLGYTEELFLPLEIVEKPVSISIKCRPVALNSDVYKGVVKVTDRKNRTLFEGSFTPNHKIIFQVPPESLADNVLALRFQFSGPIDFHAIKNSGHESALPIVFESLTITDPSQSTEADKGT